MPKRFRRPPVIFAHGFGVNWQLYELIFPLKELFAKHGMPFHVARTPFMQDAHKRAEILEKEIMRIAPTGPYHLIGHSMGGIDCRLLLSQSSIGKRCLSLTSMASPHRGGPIDDDFESILKRVHDAASILPDFKILNPIKENISNSLKALREFHPDHMHTHFNPKNPDHPDVKYFSMNFYVPQPFHEHSLVHWMKIPFDYYHRKFGHNNDGLVTVESSHWGESLGTFEGCHYSQTGPLPFKGKLQYLQNFQRIIDKIIAEFPDEKLA